MIGVFFLIVKTGEIIKRNILFALEYLYGGRGNQTCQNNRLWKNNDDIYLS